MSVGVVARAGMIRRGLGVIPAPVLAVGVGLAAVLTLVPVLWFEVLARHDSRVGDSAGFVVIACLGVLVPAGVGTLLAVRRPRNAVGWLLVGLGLEWGIDGFAGLYSSYGLLDRPGSFPGAVLVASLDEVAWIFTYTFLILIVLCFPEGWPQSRLRRRLVAATLASSAVAYGFGVVRDSHLSSPLQQFHSAFGVLGGALVGHLVGWFALLGCLIWGAVDVVRRLRRAQGVVRRQLVWFAYGATLVPAALVLCLVAHLIGISTVSVSWALAVAIVVLPATTAIAILRYRLYAIDRLVNRTLVYLVLTGLLGAVYVGLVIGLTRLFGTVAKHPSSVAVAFSTLAVAAAFLPARRKIQNAVDRRFARRRFDAVRLVEEFALRLRQDLELPERIGAVLGEALRDPTLVVGFPRLLQDNDGLLDPFGKAIPEPQVDEGRGVVKIGTAAAPTALLFHDPLLAEEPETLLLVAEAARLPLEIARLRVEVRSQLEDVRASRARIVVAQDAERRRVERDIHDGAQQRLVGLALTLQLARRKLGGGFELDVVEILDSASAELAVALEELRALARGVYPAVLREDGLSEALAALARRAPLPVSVEAQIPRLDPGVEAAAYFLASEAVTNAVRHAAASQIRICVEHDGRRLALSVSDNGTGGADPARGSGLSGLADRLAALGGTLRVESNAGRGTLIGAELPCVS